MRATDFWKSPAASGLLGQSRPSQAFASVPGEERIAALVTTLGSATADQLLAHRLPRGYHPTQLHAELGAAVAAGLLTADTVGTVTTYSPTQ